MISNGYAFQLINPGHFYRDGGQTLVAVSTYGMIGHQLRSNSSHHLLSSSLTSLTEHHSQIKIPTWTSRREATTSFLCHHLRSILHRPITCWLLLGEFIANPALLRFPYLEITWSEAIFRLVVMSTP